MAPADTLVCDTAQVAAWQSDPAFAYSRELIAPEINVLECSADGSASCWTRYSGIRWWQNIRKSY